MNRIKLTEDDFFISEETDATRAYLEICTDNIDNEQTKLIKKQILEDTEIVTDLKSGDYELMPKDKVKLLPEIVEKAKKLDQITLRGTRPVTADWIKEQAHLLFDLEEKNKQLEELYKVVEKRNKSMNDELINLKQKLEHRESQMKEISSDKIKLEKIQNVINSFEYDRFNHSVWSAVHETLKEK